MKTLFINACIRPGSRTRELAETLLAKLDDTDITTLDLGNENIRPLSNADIALRDKALATGDFSGPLFRHAKQFAAADIIVMAAPYWDLSFPAAVKTYFEAVSVCGITFRYTQAGRPQGLCRAERFFYVTTSGGYIGEFDFGFQYAKAMVQGMYGIPEAVCFRAEGLDIAGTDVEGRLEQAKKEIAEAAWRLKK